MQRHFHVRRFASTSLLHFSFHFSGLRCLLGPRLRRFLAKGRRRCRALHGQGDGKKKGKASYQNPPCLRNGARHTNGIAVADS